MSSETGAIDHALIAMSFESCPSEHVPEAMLLRPAPARACEAA